MSSTIDNKSRSFVNISSARKLKAQTSLETLKTVKPKFKNSSFVDFTPPVDKRVNTIITENVDWLPSRNLNTITTENVDMSPGRTLPNNDGTPEIA